MNEVLNPFEADKPINLLKIENLEELKYELMRKFEIDIMEGAAAALGVRTEEDAKFALSMALQSRKLEKALDDSRHEIIKPHFDYQKAINKLVKDFKDKLNQIETSLKAKIDTWVEDQVDNPFTKVDELKVEDGSYTRKTAWDFTVMDERIIPREYLQVDVAAIEKAVNTGVRNIPGVKINQTVKTTMRVKN